MATSVQWRRMQDSHRSCPCLECHMFVVSVVHTKMMRYRRGGTKKCINTSQMCATVLHGCKWYRVIYGLCDGYGSILDMNIRSVTPLDRNE